MLSLPIDNHRDTFITLLDQHDGVFVNAPPGTGKSTRVPHYCNQWIHQKLSRDASKGNTKEKCQPFGKVVVLQPRRLAAISLATRVATEQGVTLGREVGYKVRGAKEVSQHTQIVFQTYGLFFQELKSARTLSQVSVLILDEFHERQVEMDLIWAWVHYLKTQHPIPKIIVMSATLDKASFKKETENWGQLHVSTRIFPIETSYLVPAASEKLDSQVLRAIKAWLLSRSTTELPDKHNDICLCFLPGWGEIQRIKTRLQEGALPGVSELRVDVLHGSMKLKEQQAVCQEGKGLQEPRIILTTNLAETSLTIPGVTGVIDSGWEREAFWQSEKGINGLGLKRITLQSAEQRRGRAGRTGPGWCIRLWEQKWERDWKEYWRSGLLKQEWAHSLLGLLQLLTNAEESEPELALKSLPWLDAPDPSILKASLKVLKEAEAVDETGRPLPGGEWMTRLPIHPRLARVLYGIRNTSDQSLYKLCVAMVCLVEGASRGGQNSGNLLEEGETLVESQDRGLRDMRARSSFSRETLDLYKQVLNYSGSTDSMQAKQPPSSRATKNYDHLLEDVWCEALPNHIGILTSSNRYQLLSGFVGAIKVSPTAELPPALVAVDSWENRRAGKKTGDIRYWVPLPSPYWNEFLNKNSTATYVCKWLQKSKKVSIMRERSYRGIVTGSENVGEKDVPKNLVREFIVSEILSGSVESPIEDEGVKPLLNRYHLLRRAYPDYQLVDFQKEDVELLLHEWVGFKKSLKDLSVSHFITLFKDYIGPEASGLMQAKLPSKVQLPSGKTGKLTYFTEAAPELSARITDFVGMKGPYFLCDGKVEVLYNLLAPNYRTAQKTLDLTEFWTASYPGIKKELRGRYPRHPWP